MKLRLAALSILYQLICHVPVETLSNLKYTAFFFFFVTYFTISLQNLTEIRTMATDFSRRSFSRSECKHLLRKESSS